MIDIGKKSLIVGIIAVLTVFILSCPSPVDQQLAWQVEDIAAPVVTIINPDPDIKYYYPSLLEIQGLVTDYTDAEESVEGEVTSLHYEEQYNKRVHGDIDVQNDGSFSFSFNTKNPEILQGTLYIVISATDWNGNTSETIVTAYDKTEGPLIAVYNAEDFDLYSSNPATDQDITVSGRVDFTGSLSMKYTIESEFGPDPQAGINGASGEFSFTFNPSDEGVSGELTILIEASDIDGPSNYFLYLHDDPQQPQFHTDSQVNFDNSQVNLLFTEGIYHTGQTAPLDADFTLNFTAGSGTVTGVTKAGVVGVPAGGDTTISFGLSIQPLGAIAYGDEIITITASNITDRVGNAITPSSVQLNLSDQVGPTVVSVDTTLPAGTAANETDSVPITVRFSEPVSVSSLQLALNAGSGAVAEYNPLAVPPDDQTAVLEYDVTAGHNVAPLDYTNVNALTGSVEDLTGNTADLALAAVGSSSLWAKNITIDTIVPIAPVVDIDDTGDGIINISESNSGVLFTITGEVGTTYNIQELYNCTLYQGSMSGGPLPLSGDLKLEASGDGPVYVKVTLEDAAGNVSSVRQSNSVTADLTPPLAPDYENTPTLTKEAAPTWNWGPGGGDGNGTFRHRLEDSSGNTSPAPLHNWTLGAQVTSYTPSALTDGEYTLFVQERDTAGNWSNWASWTITVDLTPPSAPIFDTSSGSTTNRKPTWEWHSGGGNGNGIYRHMLENSSGSTSPAPLHGWTPGSIETSYTPENDLESEDHTLDVQERDEAGNWSDAASCTLTITN